MITTEQAKEYYNKVPKGIKRNYDNYDFTVMIEFANHILNEYKESLKEEIDMLKYNTHTLNKSGIIIALDSLLI